MLFDLQCVHSYLTLGFLRSRVHMERSEDQVVPNLMWGTCRFDMALSIDQKTKL